MWFISIIILILILGIIILIHEFGHFIWAKKFGVHIYEFSIGMGPIILKHKGKDGIDYNLRALPIGGFVSMAGEVYEDDDTKKIKAEKFMCNRPRWQRLIILLAGVINNFILAIVLLFLGGLIWGGKTIEPVIKDVSVNYPTHLAGINKGDKIVGVNGKNVSSWDVAQILMVMKNNNTKDFYQYHIEYNDNVTIDIPIIEKENAIKVTKINEDNEYYVFEIEYNDSSITEKKINKIKRQDTKDTKEIIKEDVIEKKASLYTLKVESNGKTKEVSIYPFVETNKNKTERSLFGISVEPSKLTGIFGNIKYAFLKFKSIMQSMWLTISGLITGKISLNALSGPVGMYKVVDEARSFGLDYIVYITAFLSINVGFINVLPFPAFDGGRVLFLIIEKIKGSAINSKFENTCHLIGFALLLLLMIYITIQDVIRLF